jgi:tetratricopeptide (TPR) repeat protein
MFDLLLFSYVVRSFLEYRLDEQEIRLYRAAFVFGVGMTGNAAMLGFFPLFIVALVWTRQLGFFNLRFLGRMTLCGVGGMLLYLLLPLIGSLSPDHTVSFWQLLKTNLMAQKYLLLIFPKKTLLLLSLTSILPVVLLSIRWASRFGDTSRLGVIMTTIVFHTVHAAVLLGCLWTALDPAFSPRKAGLGFVFLPLYYLGALNVGYYSGYLLVISRAVSTRVRSASSLDKPIQQATTIAILALLVLAPVTLLYRNLPQIRLTNGSMQRQFAADLARGLPAKGVILSDLPDQLWIVQDWLARNGRSDDFLPVCTAWLKQPEYHRYLKRRYPDWPSPPFDANTKVVADYDLIRLMQKLAQEKTLSYLHPSFGYYFEVFTDSPTGLGLRLTPYPNSVTNLLAPPISVEAIARNGKFWAEAQDGILKTILPQTLPPDPTLKQSFAEKLFATIRLKPEVNRQAVAIGALYSRSLVNLGVELQRANDFEAAARYFALAHDLNPDNFVAETNLAFNEKFRAGQPSPVELTKDIAERFGKFWEQVLTQNGPYDEPSFTSAQGYIFAKANLTRQAAREFDRVRALSTNDFASVLWLAQLHLTSHFPDAALAFVHEARLRADRSPGGETNMADLFTLEASCYYAKEEPEIAAEVIKTNLAAHPDNFQLLAAGCKVFADSGSYTNALAVNDQMLALNPTNAACWLNRGCFLVALNDYDKAISSFDHVLNLETNNPTALLYRAIANLRADKLDDALRDYETVQRSYPKAYQVYYGLGEIAYRRQDTNTAVRHYESYLSNAPPNYPEAKFVVNRLKELMGDQPK